ncbi:head-to-tail connector complex protein [Achromobacter phage Mano]|uniref:Head-to-tail connector complex protein n=1 Tax=Achromobacter phage Mano TaxID=2767570 RepID=A0A7L8G848_9CAUD|nr:head closure Hc1 [Achromobacter phage Mano]QOE32740.1 head-to-tail connector complex protein [Achromobacter phage Mano]
MPAPSWENLDVFLQLDDAGGFGHRAVITLQGGGTLGPIAGIFDEPYLNAQLGEYEMDTSAPRFMAKETDFPGVRRGDSFQLVDENGATVGEVYAIMSYPHQDGTGMATLELEPDVE